MKVGDLVKWHPASSASYDWSGWVGIVIREIPGTDERRQVMWNKDNNVITSNKKRDLELLSES